MGGGDKACQLILRPKVGLDLGDGQGGQATGQGEPEQGSPVVADLEFVLCLRELSCPENVFQAPDSGKIVNA